ncbi:conserved hypothetical protein [Altererythrobacter sp. B11]|uniref:hypothetical protein n=1 Tax=Altererythrobacter sp. B11 TaxID=2060312 RepID=UPI000DC700CA|nr:hypothetical protein [Altererythrobacter sp. B11]BBC73915.1 conserved hypothetical protein [Altererythrobacter sp. B11]
MEQTAEPPIADLMLAPFKLAQAMHDCNVAWCHRLAHHFLAVGFPPHPHEAPFQLEVPDPIAVEGEHDLFA